MLRIKTNEIPFSFLYQLRTKVKGENEGRYKYIYATISLLYLPYKFQDDDDNADQQVCGYAKTESSVIGIMLSEREQ